jgi:predicted dienelactone hydrolase
MKPRQLMMALLLASGLACAEGAPFKVGQAEPMVYPAAERHWRGAATQALMTVVWYPTDRSGLEQPAPIGSPQVKLFVGHPLVPQAPIAAGRHPLIVMSHGTGGSAGSLDWIASALAEQGYIVVGVNHPGNHALAPLTAEGFLLWWERATDLSEALDAVLADPQFAAHVDPECIAALGFSLGGYTVLALAGARTDRQAFFQFCRSPAADATCHPPEMDAPGIGKMRLDESSPATRASLARSGNSFRDPRIRAAFVMAPALGQAFRPHGLADVTIPLAIMAGDGDMTVPSASNASWYAKHIPQTQYELVQGGAGHYIFINVCLPAAMDQLAQVCHDARGVDRQAVHGRVIAKAMRFFGKALE